MPAISGWKLCRQFRVGIYAGNFGSENMPAILGRKICRQFRVGRYAGNFGSENMPAISGRKKYAGNVGSEQNVGKFGPERKCRQIRAGKKMSANSGRKENAGKPAIAGELTDLDVKKMSVSHKSL